MLFHFTSRHLTSLHLFHFISRHITQHQFISRHLTSLHFTSRHVSSPFSLHFISRPVTYPSRQLISLDVTLHHLTSLLFHFMSCHVTWLVQSLYVTLLLFTSRHVMPSLVTLFNLMSCKLRYHSSHHFTWRHVTSYHVMSIHSISFRFTSHHSISLHLTSRSVMSHLFTYSVSFHVTSCYVMLGNLTSFTYMKLFGLAWDGTVRRGWSPSWNFLQTRSWSKSLLDSSVENSLRCSSLQLKDRKKVICRTKKSITVGYVKELVRFKQYIPPSQGFSLRRCMGPPISQGKARLESRLKYAKAQ